MSINIAPCSSSSSSDNTPSFNNSGQSEARAMGSISQPRPLGNHHKATTTAGATTNTTTNNDDYDVRVSALSNMICQDLDFMEETMVEVKKYTDHMNVQINQARKKFEELKTKGGSVRELGELKNAVKKLKSQIPSKFKIHSADSESRPNPWLDGSINRSSNQIDVNKVDDDSILHNTAFEAFKVSFDHLLPTLRKCLLCFLRFPARVAIKKTLLIYWWIGEGLLTPIPMDPKTKEENRLRKTEEDFGIEFLDELIAKDFVEPIYKSYCSSVVDSCMMRSSIRTALIQTMVTKRSGFNSIYTPSLPQYHMEDTCLLNINAPIVDVGPELFLKMNDFKILYLGRWQSSDKHHIEVADTKILSGLKNMNQLRFLSLRGISLITELPQFISRLSNLKILDLRACHNLEVVLDGIYLLKNLTHLDMSKCYFLDHMPKSLGLLSQLQVLKGFVIGHSKDKGSCTIEDLANLSMLRKLSIYTSLKQFPTNTQLDDLGRLKTLQKLKISWSGCLLEGETNAPNQLRAGDERRERARTRKHALPLSLQKLDLESFPETNLPWWVLSSELKNLKKLSIRGGLLSILSSVDGSSSSVDGRSSSVEILQLKYLSKLEMDWSEPTELFPNLIYLEKVQCPGLTCSFCDKNGVWMKNVTTASS